MLYMHIYTYIHTVHTYTERVFDNIERMWDLSVSCPENLVSAFEIVEMQQVCYILYIHTYSYTCLHTYTDINEI